MWTSMTLLFMQMTHVEPQDQAFQGHYFRRSSGTVERCPLLTFLHNLPVFLSQWMHDDDVNDIRICNILNIKMFEQSKLLCQWF